MQVDVEMHHDRCIYEYAQCTSSLHMWHMLHENDEHTSFLCSWYHSDICQDVSPEPKSTQLNEQSLCWLEMYGQPLSWFFSLQFPALLDISLAQEPVHWYCVGWLAFHLKTAGSGIPWWRAPKKQRSDKLVLDRLIWHWVNWASFHFQLNCVMCWGFLI